jgi:hypothetical protein
MWIFYTRVEWLFICCILSFGWFPGCWILYDNVSKYCVPKRRHIKFRHQRIIQTKVHNIHKKEKSWNEGDVCGSISIVQNIKKGTVIYNCYWEEAFKLCMLRPFTLDVHTVCRWTQNLLLNSRTEISFSGFLEDYFSIRHNNRMQKFT